MIKPAWTPRFLDSVDRVTGDQWNALVKDSCPFVSHEFLSALEVSGSANRESGWLPRHLVIEDGENPIAALPLYEKTHSYGEYVFDWQWANAFQQYGKAYYPKLLTAIPFTPATGPRILTGEHIQIADVLPVIRSAVNRLSEKLNFSSWHLLFADAETRGLLKQEKDLLEREDVQFHWMNRDTESGIKYRSFEHFLEGFRSNKRKQIKRERRKITEQDIRVQRRAGDDISAKNWAEFYLCYQATYLKRSGHTGYLNKAFFDRIARTLAERCMLVTAYINEDLIASSLFFFDERRLYGRYWGAVASYDCLHFEACYYQGIEFAIERGLECFDPGTQGEHKLVRGFEPVKTHSFHSISDPEFAVAIDRFLKRELQYSNRYHAAAAAHLPFHRREPVGHDRS